MRYEFRYTQSYLYQLLRALNFCHFNRILHRDIKPANILLDQNDNETRRFGSGKMFQHSHDENDTRSSHCRAPEILLGTEIIHACRCGLWVRSLLKWYIFFFVSPLSPSTTHTHTNQQQVTGNLFSKRIRDRCVVSYFQNLGTPTDKTWPGVSSFKITKPSGFLNGPQNLEKLYRIKTGGHRTLVKHA